MRYRSKVIVSHMREVILSDTIGEYWCPPRLVEPYCEELSCGDGDDATMGLVMWWMWLVLVCAWRRTRLVDGGVDDLDPDVRCLYLERLASRGWMVVRRGAFVTSTLWVHLFEKRRAAREASEAARALGKTTTCGVPPELDVTSSCAARAMGPVQLWL